MRFILIYFVIFFSFSFKLLSQWTNVTSGIPAHTPSIIRSDSSNFVYSINNHGLFRSSNAGKKWLKLGLNDSLNFKCLYIEGNNVLVGGEGLYYSSDYGITFTTRMNRFNFIYSLEKAGDMLFAVRGGSVIRSTNFGETWIDTTMINNSIPVQILNHNNIIIIGLEPGPYSGTGGIYVSTNLGTSWIPTNLSSFTTKHLCTNGNFIFATNGNILYRSSNNGLNWSQINAPNPNGYNIHYINSINGDIYLDAFSNYFSHFYKSTDNGMTWNEILDAVELDVISLTRINSRILIGTEHDGIYHSDDNGITWDHYMPSDEVIQSIYKFGNKLIAGATNYGIYYSNDNGENWLQSKERSHSVLSFTSIDSLLFAGVFNIFEDTGGVYVSTDYGINWSITNLRDRTINCVFSLNSKLFAGEAYVGIKTSNDLGNIWEGPFIPGSIPYCFHEHNGIIYSGLYSDGIYSSTNMGQTWLKNSFINVSVKSITSSQTHIFAATSQTPGIFYSTDNGISWTNSNFLFGFARDLYFTGAFLIAGTSNNGIAISTNNGITWRLKNEGLNNFGVSAIEESEGYIFAGTYGGIYKTQIDYLTGLNQLYSEVPLDFILYQNYPNPFNPSTKINFDIPKAGYVIIKVYDLLGKEVSTLVNNKLKEGSYSIDFNASGLNSGVYFYKLTAGDFSQVKKMMLIK